MAASEPIAPMAMPMSARVSTGASLMPSPTKASLPLPAPCAWVSSSSFSTSATLSCGSSCARNSSMPSSFATAAATSARSPVSMTVFFTPAARKAATASAASGLTTSAMTMWPRYVPSAPREHGAGTRSPAVHAAPLMSLPLPTSTSRSSTRFARPGRYLRLHVARDALSSRPSWWALSGCAVASLSLPVGWSRSTPAAPMRDGMGGTGSAAAAMSISSVSLTPGCDGHHVERAVGERAGLVEHDGLGPAQRLQVVAALHEDAEARGAADAAEERQRHADDERAGARHHEEDEPALHPVGPAAAQQTAAARWPRAAAMPTTAGV